jgi:glutamate formiminotransferase / 5-formyltetrahydrofolate cyclo-ligase
MSSSLPLMAVPNVSEGRDASVIQAIGQALCGEGVGLLDVHSDSDHHRSVYTLAGPSSALSGALLAGAVQAVSRIDVMSGSGSGRPRGEHPYVGALDVAPVVYLDECSRGAACAQALVLADRIGHELGVPVFLYGELAGTDRGHTARTAGSASTRAQLRSGGVARLAQRIASGELAPDFGPSRLHPRAGATLVAARAPLVAFNLVLAPPATVDDARRIAALIRETGAEGLPGLRAIGVGLGGGSAQVSMNVERPFDTPLRLVIERVRAHAAISSAELVGLAPSAAFADFPEDIPLPGFDPSRHLIERALGLTVQLSGPDPVLDADAERER